jgi:hypothetical protein
LSPILEAALEIQGFCQSRSWRFSFIGEPLLELKGARDSAERLRRILREAS